MRFIFGVIVGIALTLAAAVLHDNNVPPAPNLHRSPAELATLQIVDWDVLGKVVTDQTAIVGRWWNSLMGRTNPPPQQ